MAHFRLTFHAALRWYSLAYLAGIVIGWWYLLKLLAPARRADGPAPCRRHGLLRDARRHPRRPARLCPVLQAGRIFPQSGRDRAPVGRRHVVPRRRDRGQPRHLLHGVAAASSIGCASTIMSPAASPSACSSAGSPISSTASSGAAPTGLPWGVVFPDRPAGMPRHPSQLYEAALEGVLLFLDPLVHVLEDPRPLPAGQARRRLHPRLRRQPLPGRIRPRARRPSRRVRRSRPTSTWASGCRCR